MDLSSLKRGPPKGDGRNRTLDGGEEGDGEREGEGAGAEKQVGGEWEGEGEGEGGREVGRERERAEEVLRLAMEMLADGGAARQLLQVC